MLSAPTDVTGTVRPWLRSYWQPTMLTFPWSTASAITSDLLVGSAIILRT